MRDTMFRVLLLAAGAAPGCAPNALSPRAEGAEYVFVPNTDRKVRICRGELLLVGRLDAEGSFRELVRYKRGQQLTGGVGGVLINDTMPDGSPRPVYEYRSGMLIKGELHDDGSFVPEIGSTIIPFKDYRYAPDAIPIWNLPGRFKSSDLKK